VYQHAAYILIIVKKTGGMKVLW